ncbi:hypothetical protein Nepgr_011647 [Nepenthes gracilis]|uniref:C2 NT-type domain-containing protein n=1 Tax=Nepenthes gracilis TaxID=150966 RepID=A0AAD3SFW5_NEPGR|nr:hypothetical protein Nepgr_011647 [Nepenthes gracilis]
MSYSCREDMAMISSLCLHTSSLSCNASSLKPRSLDNYPSSAPNLVMPLPPTKFFTQNNPNVEALWASQNVSDGFLRTATDQGQASVLALDPTLHGLNNSDPAALVIDQTRDAVSHNKGKPPLLSTDDLVQPDAKLEHKKIEAPVLFRGMASLLHPVNNLEMKILPISSSANSADLNTKSLKAPVAIRSAISFVPNMHARSTVRTLILGSLSMIRDRFSIRLEKSGNEQFLVEHERPGYTSLFLSRQITLWPLEMHSVPPLQNTLGWWCIHVTINSSSLEDHIGCKASPGTKDDGVVVSWRYGLGANLIEENSIPPLWDKFELSIFLKQPMQEVMNPIKYFNSIQVFITIDWRVPIACSSLKDPPRCKMPCLDDRESVQAGSANGVAFPQPSFVALWQTTLAAGHCLLYCWSCQCAPGVAIIPVVRCFYIYGVLLFWISVFLLIISAQNWWCLHEEYLFLYTMVLSLRTKSRRGPTVRFDYIVHLQEIKPWPPSQSLKNIRSVFIQWENGDRSSGATSIVMPSVDDGKIEFSDYFRLPVILLRDMSVRSTDTDVFLKNLLEFNLYEPRRDKTVRGQLLGTAIMDLAEYGAVKEITSVSVPINYTRSFRNTAQPILYIKIQPVDKGCSSTSSRVSMAKEASSDNNDIDSVTALMSEEAELASLADDVVSSHSSLAASSASGSLALPNGENGSRPEKENHAAPSKHGLGKSLLFIYGTPCKYTTPLQDLSAWTSTNYQPGCVNVACAIAQIDDAKKAAAAADATVLIVGADQSNEAESWDRVDLLLPGQQQLLVTEVAKASRGPLVLVIMFGGGFDISSSKDDDKVSSILWVGYPGETGEAAISPQRFDEENPISILDEILMIIQDDIDCYPHLSKGATTWVPEVWPIKKDAVFVSRLHSCGIILIEKAIMHESYCGVVPTVVIFEYVTAGWTRENTGWHHEITSIQVSYKDAIEYELFILATSSNRTLIWFLHKIPSLSGSSTSFYLTIPLDCGLYLHPWSSISSSICTTSGSTLGDPQDQSLSLAPEEFASGLQSCGKQSVVGSAVSLHCCCNEVVAHMHCCIACADSKCDEYKGFYHFSTEIMCIQEEYWNEKEGERRGEIEEGQNEEDQTIELRRVFSFMFAIQCYCLYANCEM